MAYRIPFLRPNLVSPTSFIEYFNQIDRSRIYSNGGPLSQLFEQRMQDEIFNSVGNFALVSSGTSALMLAISQLRKSTGRYALMPSFTFAATPLAAIWCGLEPFFLDVESSEWSMDHQLVQEAIETLGDDLAIVIPYATFGSAIDLAFYEDLHNKGIPVVVDAAASMGTKQDGKQFGEGFSGAVIFSFHATKTFCVGEGGAVYSVDKELIEKIKSVANFGFDKKRVCDMPGLNAKASEYSAAIALATLDVFGDKVRRRMDITEQYKKQLAQQNLFATGFELQVSNGDVVHQHLPILVPQDKDALKINQKLAETGIESRFYFNPACHQQPQFESYSKFDLSITESISRRVINLPFWEEMTELDIEFVVTNLAQLSR